MKIKFDKDPLAVDQNSYLTKVVNICIVYDLDAWPRCYKYIVIFGVDTNLSSHIDHRKDNFLV